MSRRTTAGGNASPKMLRVRPESLPKVRFEKSKRRPRSALASCAAANLGRQAQIAKVANLIAQQSEADTLMAKMLRLGSRTIINSHFLTRAIGTGKQHKRLDDSFVTMQLQQAVACRRI